MAYEYRATQNYQFGQLDTPAAQSDTTLSSPDFVELITGLSTGFYLPITLQDPATDSFEVVWATKHDPASTTITVVRGREGTTAKPWPSKTQWSIAPTVRDVTMAVNSSTIPSDLQVGGRVVEADTGLTKAKTWSAGMVAGAGLCLPADVGKTSSNGTVPSTATILTRMGCFFNQSTSGELVSVTFPTPFPNGFIGGLATSIDANIFVGYNGDIRNGSKTGMTLHPMRFDASPLTSASMFWVAYGW